MNTPELPPILNTEGRRFPKEIVTKEYESLVEKYKQEEDKLKEYCYKPYRTIYNY